jgi:spermidine synthase
MNISLFGNTPAAIEFTWIGAGLIFVKPQQKEKRLNGMLLGITVFVSGAVVMIYEINGSRIIAPYIGSSVYVWTSLIGTILAALSLGYWLGGRAADRIPRPGVLAAAIFSAGGLVGTTILLKDVILMFVVSLPTGLEVRSIVSALFLFAPASVALGFVIPYATKLRLSSLDDTGKTVGQLYALSTVGSIVGTFSAGFLFIPYIGSTRTLYILTAVLFVLAFSLFPLKFNRTRISLLLITFLAVVWSEAGAYWFETRTGLKEVDTQYSRIRVFDSTDSKTGRPIRVLLTDPYSTQSAKFLDGDDLALEYTKYYDLVRHFVPDIDHGLMIGGAGYSYPSYFLRHFPEAKLDVVEIDPGLTEIARSHFGLRDAPNLRIFHEDGRVFLNSVGSKSYDAVFVDAFGSLFSVPFHLATVEAVGEMHRALRDKGVVIVNIGSAISGPGSEFLQSEYQTLIHVFGDVRAYQVDPKRDVSELQNVILVALKDRNIKRPEPVDTEIKRMLGNEIKIDLDESAQILTDDYAPVEAFVSRARRHDQKR